MATGFNETELALIETLAQVHQAGQSKVDLRKGRMEAFLQPLNLTQDQYVQAMTTLQEEGLIAETASTPDAPFLVFNIKRKLTQALRRAQQEQSRDPQAEQDWRDQERQDIDLAARGVPRPLIKATSDASDYALGLKNGTVFTFTEASIHGQWVCLEGVRSHSVPAPMRYAATSEMAFSFDRGVEVRLDEIAWVADAPWGS
jgi:hypothetical protein